jgi:septal ring factor EnvC (AmiA/AmiB activator)
VRKIEIHLQGRLLGAMAVMVLLANFHGAVAADQPPAGAKPTTIKSAISDVGDISTEVRKLEKHLASIEQSVAAINESLKRIESMDKSFAEVSASLAPVAALTRPEGLTALISQVSDTAFSRGVALVLIGTGCAGALIVLLAYTMRWSRRPISPESP